MKRAIGISLLLFALTAQAAPVRAAPGDLPPRTPVFVNRFMTYTYPKTTYTVQCIDFGARFGGRPATMSMFAYVLEDLKGKRLASSVAVRDGLNSDYVTASAAGQRTTQIVRRTGDDPVTQETFQITAKSVGLLRIGFASWGDHREGSGFVFCFLSYLLLGRYPVTMGPAFASSSAARIAYASDFTGGAGAATAVAGIGVSQTLTRKVKGYAFSVFRPGSGSAKIVDPRKKVRYDGAAGTGKTSVAERSSGTWTYTLDAAVAQSRSPALWLMELPA